MCCSFSWYHDNFCPWTCFTFFNGTCLKNNEWMTSNALTCQYLHAVAYGDTSLSMVCEYHPAWRYTGGRHFWFLGLFPRSAAYYIFILTSQELTLCFPHTLFETLPVSTLHHMAGTAIGNFRMDAIIFRLRCPLILLPRYSYHFLILKMHSGGSRCPVSCIWTNAYYVVKNLKWY